MGEEINVMKKEKLYNVGWFPIWMLMYMPTFWFITLPINFVIDSIVLLIAFAVLKVENRKDKYWKSIFQVWKYGFVADFIGAVVMTIVTFGVYDGKKSEVGLSLMMDPRGNTIALLWTILSIIISSIFIYIFDSKKAFANTDLSEKRKKQISLIMAIFTAPYTMLSPTGFIYGIIYFFMYGPAIFY